LPFFRLPRVQGDHPRRHVPLPPQPWPFFRLPRRARSARLAAGSVAATLAIFQVAAEGEERAPSGWFRRRNLCLFSGCRGLGDTEQNAPREPRRNLCHFSGCRGSAAASGK